MLPAVASTELINVVNEIRLPDGFLVGLHEHIANILGLHPKRIMVFDDMTYARIKMADGTTKPHADFYHFVESTDLLMRLRGLTKVDYNKDMGLCVLCMLRRGICFDHVCLCSTCANGPIPLYTAWVSLGAYTNKLHPLMDFVGGSIDANYSHLTKDVLEREVPKGLKINKGKWQYPTPKGLSIYDILIFNCKMVHRAQQKSHMRMSIDVRFAILPSF